ncbi:MAG: hypothetical protein M3Y74_08950 [Chloroflexota bacterium]|nr:hypothetical protein [Chloroflexota bacterium]
MEQHEHEPRAQRGDDEDDPNEEEEYEDDYAPASPPAGVIQIRTQTLLLWLVGILLVVSIVNTFMGSCARLCWRILGRRRYPALVAQ